MKKVKLSFEYGNTETVFNNILYDPSSLLLFHYSLYSLCEIIEKWPTHLTSKLVKTSWASVFKNVWNISKATTKTSQSVRVKRFSVGVSSNISIVSPYTLHPGVRKATIVHTILMHSKFNKTTFYHWKTP